MKKRSITFVAQYRELLVCESIPNCYLCVYYRV